MTIGGLVEAYLAERRTRGEISALTARNARCTLHRFARLCGDRPLSQLGPRDVDRWLADQEHLAKATRRARISVLRGFARWCVKRRYIARELTRELEPIRQPRTVARAQSVASVGQLMGVLPDTRAQTIVWLMVGMGLRCGEVARLEIADWDRQAEVVFVTGKGGHQRFVPVIGDARAAFERYLAAHPALAGPFIRSYRRPSHPLAADSISHLVSRWWWESGVKQRARDGVSAHALRHTAASDVADNATDVRIVQEMLGHAHLNTTQIYLRPAGLSRMREAMEGRKYNPGEEEHQHEPNTTAGDAA